jgi:hypothetical protein
MATSSNTLIATRSGEVLFIEKGSVLMNSQPMFITRHPRHRTGVHTCAVTTGSGTPGPPYHSHTRYSISRRAGRRAALKPRPVALIHTVAWSLTNQKKTTVARLLYQAQMLSN